MFPKEMISFDSSWAKEELAIIRACSFFLVLLTLVPGIFFNLVDQYSIQNILSFTAGIFQCTAIVAYSIPWLDKIVCLLFITSWAFTTTFTIALIIIEEFFKIKTIIYIFPWLTLFFDFFYNQISFIRIQYVFPIVYIEFISLAIFTKLFQENFNVSFWESAAMQQCFLAIGLVVLEASRVFKGSSMRSEVSEKLI